jgi:hypothetical protein
MDMMNESPAEKAAEAQAGMITRRSQLYDQLSGLFQRPDYAFSQNPALGKALSDKNLVGMASGFAKRQLVKDMLGIGQPGTGGIGYAQQEDASNAAAAAQMGEVIGQIMASKSDQGQGVTAQGYLGQMANEIDQLTNIKSGLKFLPPNLRALYNQMLGQLAGGVSQDETNALNLAAKSRERGLLDRFGSQMAGRGIGGGLSNQGQLEISRGVSNELFGQQRVVRQHCQG